MKVSIYTSIVIKIVVIFIDSIVVMMKDTNTINIQMHVTSIFIHLECICLTFVQQVITNRGLASKHFFLTHLHNIYKWTLLLLHCLNEKRENCIRQTHIYTHTHTILLLLFHFSFSFYYKFVVCFFFFNNQLNKPALVNQPTD